MADDDYTESSREQWGNAADAWGRAAEEEETGASARATEWMLDEAGLEPGEQVLELACGAGRVGLQAARRVGPSGSVLCSDFSQEMVDAVEARIDRIGVENVRTAVLDAQDLTLDSDSFDVVLCRFGYMLMPDPLQALVESHRVLMPGGRLVLAVWGSGEENPWLTTILTTVMDQLGAPPPEPGTPGPFALGDPRRLEGLLKEACLEDIEVVSLDAEQSYDSPQGWWQHTRDVGGPLAALLDGMPAEDAKAVKERALDAARRYERDDGVVFPARIVAARTLRPA
jgi:enediyne biosynthesis protein CalE5